jgi:putative endonuclease
MTHRRKRLGAEGERAAEGLLRREGYRVLARNYRCPLGEIDLVALDGRTVVFVEVKTRTDESFGDPLEAVGARKQRQIARVAEYYLSAHRLAEREARFDVVGVRFENGQLACELVKDAFEAPR